jgi:8-oxo-dGTP diphosphatase
MAHNKGRPKNLRVVAALVRERGEVLLTQRRPGRHLGLSWEFPGGKVELGETDQEALAREMREELGVEVRIGTLCFETRHTYGSREMHLLVYRARITQGTPVALDTHACAWVAEGALKERTFLPADMPLVHGITEGLVAIDDEDVAVDDEEDDDEPEFRAAQVVRAPGESGSSS